jgi:hypothetical protein
MTARGSHRLGLTEQRDAGRMTGGTSVEFENHIEFSEETRVICHAFKATCCTSWRGQEESIAMEFAKLRE